MIATAPGDLVPHASLAPWWTAAGVTPVVVYFPWGRDTIYQGYLNQADPDTYLIVAGEAPDWEAIYGWKFDGSTHYLETGVVPEAHWSMLILFRNTVEPGGTLGGMFEMTGRDMRLIVDRSGDVLYYANGGGEVVDGALIDGCLVVAGQVGYRNGVADTDTLEPWVGHSFRDLWIGARQSADSSTPISPYPGDILAFAAWDVTLNAQQVERVYNAVMQATYFDDLTNTSSRTLWSSSGSHDWIGRPILIDNDGTWIVTYRSAVSHTGNATDEIHLRFSSNEGVSWSDEDELLDGTPVTGAPFMRHSTNTAAGMDLMIAPNGDLLLHVGEVDSLFNPAGIYQWRSTDDGATWSDEGLIDGDTELYGGQDYTYIDNNLYLSVWRHETGNTNNIPNHSQFYVTTDNGTTWALVSNITEYADETNEVSIEYVGNGNMLSFLRDDNVLVTWMRRSTDYGLTWGDLTDYTSVIGNMQRTRLKHIGERLYLFGRHRIGGSQERSVLWYSDEDGADGSWRGPYYAGGIFTDCGYCDILERSNGDIYMLTYEGTTGAASVVEHVMQVNR